MKSSSISDAVRIAVPMTLNTLAGGAAGGASGIEARTAGIMVLVASFCMMKMGHTAGVYLMTSKFNSYNFFHNNEFDSTRSRKKEILQSKVASDVHA